jgi:predicted dehydrogenase
MNPIRWGIIGCGDVTEVKSGPGFQKAAGSALVAVMRRDGAKAADYARRHDVPKYYDDAAKLIADPQVDAVYIATPPAQHESYALAVCAAGKPCYVEKPMARNAAEAQRMSDAFAARGIPLYVAYYRRGMPRFWAVRKFLDGGGLGRLKTASFTQTDSQMSTRQSPVPWRLQPELAGAGLFLDVGSHVLDLLDFFLGPLADVKGAAQNTGRQYDVEDTVSLTFTAGGVSGQGHWNFNHDRKQDEYVFTGEKGTLRFSGFGTEPPVVQTAQGTTQLTDFVTPPHVQQPLIQAIVDSLRGNRHAAQWLPTGPVGVRTQNVMDQAIANYYGDRQDGFWTRPRRG